MNRIVVLDGYTLNPGDISWSALEKVGELSVYDRTSPDELDERIGDANIVLVNKVPLSRTVFEGHPQLECVCVLATGYDVVDIQAAKENGVVVMNVPGYGSEAVAQHAIALLLAVTNRVKEHSDRVHAGAWNQAEDWCFWDHPLVSLAGKKMGIIGYGRIGERTGSIAQALGMQVLAYKRRPDKSLETKTLKFVDLDTLYREADVISLHCPATPENQGMINRETISKMKKGVILINTSRGSLIDEKDVGHALREGKIQAAGLDVLNHEPPEEDSTLIGLDNCLITPHIAWAAKESRERLMDIAVSNLETYLQGSPQNVVS